MFYIDFSVPGVYFKDLSATILESVGRSYFHTGNKHSKYGTLAQPPQLHKREKNTQKGIWAPKSFNCVIKFLLAAACITDASYNR